MRFLIYIYTIVRGGGGTTAKRLIKMDAINFLWINKQLSVMIHCASVYKIVEKMHLPTFNCKQELMKNNIQVTCFQGTN